MSLMLLGMVGTWLQMTDLCILLFFGTDSFEILSMLIL